ncbi:MAG: right-handed parallel beta-helix repeat-containing protein [Candidatus Nanopelagicales bacterium]
MRKGTYPQTNTPNYWESRWGTAAAPIVINAADGARTATLRGDINAYDVRHLTVQGIVIDRAGDTVHCEKCSYVTLRNVRLNGRGAAHETLKANQSDHLTITGSDIGGSYENAIDFVAVRYALIRGNRIHHAEDWCAYVKGGSAYITVSDNVIDHCGTGGFTAGQGTGFEFMVAPWLRYETYGVTVVRNVIHDTDGAGLGVNGGYNTVMAYNTLYRVGARSHTVEFVHGSRSCDGDTVRCAQNRNRGGWGGVGVDGQYIPSRHTYFLNNLVINPTGYQSQWQQLQLDGPVTAPSGSGVPNPSRVDTDLVILGNVFVNGGSDMPTGLEGARDRAFLRDNRVNTLVPDLVAPATGDFRPVPGGRIATLPVAPLPTMTWSDAGVPAGPTVTLPADHPPGALLP